MWQAFGWQCKQIRAEGLHPNGQRVMVERLSLRILLLVIIQCCQVVQAGRYVGIGKAEGLGPDGERRCKAGSALARCRWVLYSIPRLFRLWATSG
jgi:hypothetical protein